MKMINSQWRNRSRNNRIATSIKFGNASHAMPDKKPAKKCVACSEFFPDFLI